MLPETGPMQEQCQANLSTWKQLAEQRKVEQQEKLEEEKAAAEEEAKPDVTDDGEDNSETDNKVPLNLAIPYRGKYISIKI